MVSIIQMVFSSVLGDPVLINAALANQQQSSPWYPLVCCGAIVYVALAIVVAFNWETIERANSTIQVQDKLIEIEEMPGKKVLLLEWVDIQNYKPGKKHYLVRKSYGSGFPKYEDVGSTDQFFFIDRTYRTDDLVYYVVVCMEDKRTSHTVRRNWHP